jgi:hypothetical protein
MTRKTKKRVIVEFVSFLEWWDELSYSSQQKWLKSRETNFRYRNDSNYLIAAQNQKSPQDRR